MFSKFSRVFFYFLILITPFIGYSAGIPQQFENPQAIEYAQELLPHEGVLKIKDGYIFLKIDDRYIYDLFAQLTQEGLEIPPYFRTESSTGAHISVIYETERQQLPIEIPEIGQTFHFEIKNFNSIFLKDHEEVYVLVVSAPELEALRNKYGLSSKLLGHEFHITIAIKNYPSDQVIMKELRFWYNGKWFKYHQSHHQSGDWGTKPYLDWKGLPDDYNHLTRADLRRWWNTRIPGFYAATEGFDDDHVPVTMNFLENWFKTVSPDGWTP